MCATTPCIDLLIMKITGVNPATDTVMKQGNNKVSTMADNPVPVADYAPMSVRDNLVGEQVIYVLQPVGENVINYTFYNAGLKTPVPLDATDNVGIVIWGGRPKDK
jgi:hypothetical protein